MAFSSEVSAGNTILASQYNNLRKDVIDIAGGHTHDGVDSRMLFVDNMNNIFMGDNALQNITTSYNNNIAIGQDSLTQATTCNDNVAIGSYSLSAVTTGDSNIGIGWGAGNMNITTGYGNIVIGRNAVVPSGTGSHQIQLGNTSTNYAGIQVAWTVTSDRAFKENIKECNLGLDFINKLKPVEYTRKNDENKKVEYGLIAQDLEKVLDEFKVENSGILLKDDKDKLHLRYNDLFAILIKSIQEQSVEIQNLKSNLKG